MFLSMLILSVVESLRTETRLRDRLIEGRGAARSGDLRSGCWTKLVESVESRTRKCREKSESLVRSVGDTEKPRPGPVAYTEMTGEVGVPRDGEAISPRTSREPNDSGRVSQ